MAQLNVPVVFHFADFGLLIVELTIFSFSGFTQAPPRPFANTGILKFVKPSAAIKVLVCLTLSAMLTEGSAIDW